jgi:hypothetical protein
MVGEHSDPSGYGNDSTVVGGTTAGHRPPYRAMVRTSVGEKAQAHAQPPHAE